MLSVGASNISFAISAIVSVSKKSTSRPLLPSSMISRTGSVSDGEDGGAHQGAEQPPQHEGHREAEVLIRVVE